MTLLLIGTMLPAFYAHAEAEPFSRLKKVGSLQDGDSVLIAYKGEDGLRVLGTRQNRNNRAAVSGTGSSSLTPSSSMCVLALADAGNGLWTLYDAENDGYLCAASDAGLYLRTAGSVTAAAKWRITAQADGTFRLAAAQYLCNILRYNLLTDAFVCSPETGVENLAEVTLYVRHAEPTATPSETPAATPSETPTATPSETPAATPSDSPTATSSETSTETPSPTPMPTSTPSSAPTPTPTATPSETPTATPSETPTETPSSTPTATPTP